MELIGDLLPPGVVNVVTGAPVAKSEKPWPATRASQKSDSPLKPRPAV
jgi:hypothetical protein